MMLICIAMHKPLVTLTIRPHTDPNSALRAGIPQMCATAPEQALPDKGFAKQQLDVFFGPLTRG